MFRPQRSSKFRNYNNNARQYARPPRPPPAPYSPWDCNPWINFGPVPPGMVPYPPYEPQGNHEMFNMPPPGPPLPVFVNYAMHDPYMMPQLYQPPIPQSHQPPIPHTLQPPMPVHDMPDQAPPLDQYQSFPVPQFQPAMMPPPLQYFPHLMTAPVAAPYPFINLKPQRRPRAIPIIDPHTHEDILLKIYNDFTYPPPPSSPEDKQRFLPNETPMNEHSEQLEWSDAEPTSAEQQLPPPTNVNSFVMNETNITVLAEQAATPLSEQAAMSLAEQAATPLAEQAVMPLAEQAATSLTDETTTPLTEQTPMIIADQTPTPLTEQTPKIIADQAPNPLTEQTPTIIADQTPTPLTEQLATPLTEQLATPLTEQLATSLTEQARTPFEDLTPMQFTDQDVTSFAEPTPTTLEEEIPEEFFSYSVHRRYRRSRLRPFLPAIPEEPAVISQWCSNVMASEVKEEKAASPIDSDQSYDADESSSTPEPVLSPQDQLMAVIGNAKESKYRRKCAKKALARIHPAAQSSSSSSQEDAARFRKLGATFERVRTVRIQRGRQVSSSAISLDNCRGKEQSLPAKRCYSQEGGAIYTGNVMKINSVQKEDRGTYYCVADNGVSKGDRRNINLEVEFSPVISVPRPRLGQALQYDMDLECHVEAYPSPAIVWVKDDVQLSNNQHYGISLFATADEFTDTTLRVITIEKRQYGEYYCRAINKLGQAEAKVELFETVIPVCPPACGQSYYGGDASAVSASTMLLVVTALAAMF